MASTSTIQSRITSRNCIRRSLVSTRKLSISANPQQGVFLTSTTTKSPLNLPPTKMRALISLYHQSETWITPENLLQRIDEAFVPTDMDPVGEQLFQTRDLRSRLNRLRNAPKMVQWASLDKSAANYQFGTAWSDGRRKRERKVMEALYGVDNSVSGPLQPGLEMVKESAEAVMRRHLTDRKNTKDEANFKK